MAIKLRSLRIISAISIIGVYTCFYIYMRLMLPDYFLMIAFFIFIGLAYFSSIYYFKLPPGEKEGMSALDLRRIHYLFYPLHPHSASVFCTVALIILIVLKVKMIL